VVIYVKLKDVRNKEYLKGVSSKLSLSVMTLSEMLIFRNLVLLSLSLNTVISELHRELKRCLECSYFHS
jgi:hypothetical protein